jgi:hypothetical protein
MKLRYAKVDLTATARIEHGIAVYDHNNPSNGATVSISKAFPKASIEGSGSEDKENIFIAVNKFLDSNLVTIVDKKALLEYCKIFAEYGMGTDKTYKELTIEAKAIIVDMMGKRSFNLGNINKWARLNIRKPESVLEAYPVHREGLFSKESTYLAKEYYDLVSGAIFIRLILPVLTVILTKADVLYGRKAKFSKSMMAFPNAFLETDFVTRLKCYQNEYMKNIHIRSEDVINFELDEENKNTHYLSVVMYKVLVPGKLLTADDTKHLISLLYSKLAGDTASMSPTTSHIKNKSSAAGSADDPHSKSILESYRASTTLNISDIELLKHQGDEGYLLNLLGKRINTAEYRRVKDELVHSDMELTELHLYLLKITLSEIVLPTAYAFFDKTAAVTLLTIAHLLLRDINPIASLLMVSTPLKDADGILSVPSYISTTTSEKVRETIEARYDITEIIEKHGKTEKNKPHYVIESMHIHAKMLSTYVWAICTQASWVIGQKGVEDGSLNVIHDPMQFLTDVIMAKEEVVKDIKHLSVV